MKKMRNQIGVTLSEVLLVLAIISVLAGVGFVEVNAYMRDITKLEYDGYAKEIFVAAQNHLAMAESQGYLGRAKDAENARDAFGTSDGESGYYLVSSIDGNDPNSVFGLMLPAASIDETVRRSGSYIVHYDPANVQVLDVFYWTQAAGRYPHEYKEGDFSRFMEQLASLKQYGEEKSVIGYYGGVKARALPTITLEAPVLRVYNEDQLYVIVKDNNYGVTQAKDYNLKLIVTQANGTASKSFPLSGYTASPGEYKVILDSITSDSGKHYAELKPDDFLLNFVPGEDIRIQAVAEGNEVFAIPKYAVGTGPEDGILTNSLFGDGTKPGEGKVDISSIRHLENLDQSVSKMDLSVFGVSNSSGTLSAVQSTDLKWKDFLKTGENIVPLEGVSPEKEKYYPVTPVYKLNYDGDGHSVYDVSVKSAGHAGMFGALGVGCSVSNLKLQSFTISGESDAGALAGTVNGTIVTNVLSVNAGNNDTPITGSGSVGGLVGSATDATIEKCAAAMPVKSTGGNAGGLIGTVTGSTAITACYSGGHTEDGSYTDNYNVTGAQAAGGLIGSSAGATITYSYSTCSVSGKTAEGGFVGSATGGRMENCYAAGRVDPSTENAKGAFAGSNVSVTNCHYYMIINEIAPDKSSSKKEYSYLPPYPGADTEAEANMAFDWSAETFNTFVGGDREAARPYDSALLGFYRGKYGLPTVKRLGAVGVELTDFVSAHYGDWPAPEIWVINN